MATIVRWTVLAAVLLWPAVALASAEEELAALLTAPLAKGFGDDWRSIERMRGVRWAPLPPKMLQNCLPDGGCFTRDGVAQVGGRRIGVGATGARMMAGNFYFRNAGAPFGEAAVLAALKRAGHAVELKRCPVPGSAGGQNWYRVAGPRSEPGILAVQTSCRGQPCEGFAVTRGEELPPLQPQQLRMYSLQCSGDPAQRQAVSTVLPHEQFARSLVALLPALGTSGHDWTTLKAAASGIRWNPGPKPTSLAYKNDPNPLAMTGQLEQPGRKFSVVFAGTPTRVMTGYLEELGSHPRGEDLLAALRAQGLGVQLVRCGPVYTQASHNWYRVGGPRTRPVMLQRSMTFDGARVIDSVALRLDASLPPRDPRDREPGAGGCR